MSWLLAAVVFALALLHGARTGHVFDTDCWAQRIANGFVSLALVAFASAAIQRAYTQAPFLQTYWLVVVTAGGGVVAHVVLMLREASRARDRRYALNEVADELESWLSEVQELDPCVDVNCQRIRREMAAKAARLRAAHA